MANTIARARGWTKAGNPQNQEVTRLGGGAATAEANTWRTFASAFVQADGSGYIDVKRDGVTLSRFTFGPEGLTD